MIFAGVILFSGGLVAFAATTLFTQNIQGQSFTTAELTEGSCGNSLVLDTALGTIPPFAGETAALFFDCGETSSGISAAFTASTPAAPVTPTFTITTTGWTLYICTITLSSCTALTSGVSVSSLIGTGYIYELVSSSAADFASFTITWSQ
jgi:hypothetical protein